MATFVKVITDGNLQYINLDAVHALKVTNANGRFDIVATILANGPTSALPHNDRAKMPTRLETVNLGGGYASMDDAIQRLEALITESGNIISLRH